MGKRRKKMGAKDEDGNVNADDIPADAREIVQSLQKIFEDVSEQEIYAVLVECKMDAEKAIDRLLVQDPFQQVKSKRGKMKETKDTADSCSQGVDDSRIQNPESRYGDEHDVGQGGGNSFNSEETSNDLAGSSTTSGILGPSISETRSVPVSPVEAVPSLSKPSSSDVTNGERKRVPISSVKAVPSLSVRPSRWISAGQGTMAEVVKAAIAPVKDVTNPVPNISTQSASRRDQLGESATVSNQNLRNDDSGGSRLLCDEDKNKNAKDPAASVVTSLQQLSIEDDKPEESVEEDGSSCLPPHFFDDESENFADELSLRDLNTRGGESSGREDLNNDGMAYQTEVNAARENPYTSSSASDFTFDVSQRSNPTPWRSSLQMQGFSTFPEDVMHQRPRTRGPHPPYSAFPFNQPMPREHRASSFARMPITPWTEVYFGVPLSLGNMVNPFYAPPRQNIPYRYQPPQPPLAAFRPHGGRNSSIPYYYPPLAVPIVPSVYVPAYLSGTLGFIPRHWTQQHQIVNPNVWPVQGEHTHSASIPPHRNQQSPSFRNSQQEQQEQEQQPYGRSSPYNDESLDQQNSRRDPSHRT